MIRIALKITVAVLVALIPLAGMDSGGEYHVYGCRTPGGAAAPADGWSGAIAPGSASDDYALDTCAEGGALVAALGESTSHEANVDEVTWTFSAPSGTRVLQEEVWRAGYLHGAAGEKATYQFWLAGPLVSDVFDECIFTVGCHVQGEVGDPYGAANRVVVPGGNTGQHLFMSISCGAGGSGNECGHTFSDPNGYAAVVYLYASDITLEQEAGPSVGAVGGELAGAPSVSGTADLTFNATDPGAGVYAATVTVDGSVLQTTPLDENGGRCRNVGETTDGLMAFLYVQPCLQSVGADVPVNTAGLSNGAHHLVVSVLDAAGNSAVALDRTLTVANPQGGAGSGVGGAGGPGAPGSPNGTNASPQAQLLVAWRGSHRRRLAVAYGRTEIATGRLLAPGGAPVGGAQVDVTATAAAAGARALALPVAHTGADGRFSVRMPPGASSRALRFAYSSIVGGAPTVTASLALSVRAGLRLSIAPRTSSVGHTIRFSGRLLGGPFPASGKLVVLEARSKGGPWIEFRVVRANRAGRFRARYRFRLPGPQAYSFRAVAEAEGDYPYATGASGGVPVLER